MTVMHPLAAVIGLPVSSAVEDGSFMGYIDASVYANYSTIGFEEVEDGIYLWYFAPEEQFCHHLDRDDLDKLIAFFQAQRARITP